MRGLIKIIAWIVSSIAGIVLLLNISNIVPHFATENMNPGIIKEFAESSNWARDVSSHFVTNVWKNVKPNLGYFSDEIREGAKKHGKDSIKRTKKVLEDESNNWMDKENAR